MKSAKLYLLGLYLHLLLSIGIPAGIFYFCSDGWNAFGIGLLLFYLTMIFATLLTGCVCTVMSVIAYRKKEAEKLKTSWKLLKINTIPFYLLNFIYSFFIWFILVGASRGIMIIFVPIPILITGLTIIPGGVIGICLIRLLRSQSENPIKPAKIHYFLQMIFILDIISTIILLKKQRFL